MHRIGSIVSGGGDVGWVRRGYRLRQGGDNGRFVYFACSDRQGEAETLVA